MKNFAKFRPERVQLQAVMTHTEINASPNYCASQVKIRALLLVQESNLAVACEMHVQLQRS